MIDLRLLMTDPFLKLTLTKIELSLRLLSVEAVTFIYYEQLDSIPTALYRPPIFAQTRLVHPKFTHKIVFLINLIKRHVALILFSIL